MTASAVQKCCQGAWALKEAQVVGIHRSAGGPILAQEDLLLEKGEATPGDSSASLVAQLKNLPGNAELVSLGSRLWWSPEKGGYPLQNCGLENSMAFIVHGSPRVDTTEWLSLSLPFSGHWKQSPDSVPYKSHYLALVILVVLDSRCWEDVVSSRTYPGSFLHLWSSACRHTDISVGTHSLAIFSCRHFFPSPLPTHNSAPQSRTGIINVSLCLFLFVFFFFPFFRTDWSFKLIQFF